MSFCVTSVFEAVSLNNTFNCDWNQDSGIIEYENRIQRLENVFV
jgi:hypothetical protein